MCCSCLRGFPRNQIGCDKKSMTPNFGRKATTKTIFADHHDINDDNDDDDDDDDDDNDDHDDNDEDDDDQPTWCRVSKALCWTMGSSSWLTASTRLGMS